MELPIGKLAVITPSGKIGTVSWCRVLRRGTESVVAYAVKIDSGYGPYTEYFDREELELAR